MHACIHVEAMHACIHVEVTVPITHRGDATVTRCACNGASERHGAQKVHEYGVYHCPQVLAGSTKIMAKRKPGLPKIRGVGVPKKGTVKIWVSQFHSTAQCPSEARFVWSHII